MAQAGTGPLGFKFASRSGSGWAYCLLQCVQQWVHRMRVYDAASDDTKATLSGRVVAPHRFLDTSTSGCRAQRHRDQRHWHCQSPFSEGLGLGLSASGTASTSVMGSLTGPLVAVPRRSGC